VVILVIYFSSGESISAIFVFENASSERLYYLEKSYHLHFNFKGFL